MNNKLIGGAILIGVIIGLIIFYKPNTSQIERQPIPREEISVGQDICGDFSKDWVQSILNKKIVRAEEIDSNATYVCQYYFEDDTFITLRLSNLSFENQKKGQQSLGRSISTNSNIQLTHFIAYQENNIINDVILKINPNLILAVDRSSIKALNESEIINFAARVSERIQKGENRELISTITSSPILSPLQERKIIETFFQLIDDKKISNAIELMSSTTDSMKQSFAVQFSAMRRVKVIKIEEIMKQDWTEKKHEYMVTLDVEMNADSASNPIPYFGYERGENIRFISLVNENELWKVSSIGTGP